MANRKTGGKYRIKGNPHFNQSFGVKVGGFKDLGRQMDRNWLSTFEGHVGGDFLRFSGSNFDDSPMIIYASGNEIRDGVQRSLIPFTDTSDELVDVLKREEVFVNRVAFNAVTVEVKGFGVLPHRKVPERGVFVVSVGDQQTKSYDGGYVLQEEKTRIARRLGLYASLDADEQLEHYVAIGATESLRLFDVGIVKNISALIVGNMVELGPVVTANGRIAPVD